MNTIVFIVIVFIFLLHQGLGSRVLATPSPWCPLYQILLQPVCREGRSQDELLIREPMECRCFYFDIKSKNETTTSWQSLGARKSDLGKSVFFAWS